MAKQFMLTDEGLKKYESELEELKTVRRKEIADKIKLALSFGDLSENSEYDEAKNEQAKLESRIAELEAMLKDATVIDEDENNPEVVHVGTHLRILDVAYKEELTYQIVGSAEADPRGGRISDESPVGKALIGGKAGQTVVAVTPGGETKYKILEILR